MQTYDLIQVLWVEDDPQVTKAYPLKAEVFDLDLIPFSCWDDARDALEKDYDRWSAIILDAKCKFHRDSADSAIVFLREALKDIAAMSKERGRVIPWYVLTGGAESEVSDSINDDRLKWDADWTNSSNKKYYSKNVDNEILYERIGLHAQKSPRIQIQEIYRDTYEQLKSLNNEDVCEDILTILETMHFPQLHPDFAPRLYYNPMRKALEYVFRSANEVGIIPDVFFPNGKVNLNQCFMYLIGSDAEKMGLRFGNNGEAVVPRHIHDMMSLIINLGNVSSHSTEQFNHTELSEEEIQEYENYVTTSGINSRILLFSIALQFCEIVQWMNNYKKENPNKEINLGKCKTINKDTSVLLKGKINKDRNRVYYSSNYIIDKSKGFMENNTPQEYEYKEGEDVFFELRKTTNPKTGVPFAFAKNVRPIVKSNSGENGSK